jgi:hypothetical protein
MTGILTWRYLVDYARRPLNLALLAVVPLTFVTLSAVGAPALTRLSIDALTEILRA